MPEYLTTAGDTVTFAEPAPAVADFLARAHAAAADPAATVAQLVELVYGPDNPILDRTVNPARPMVTAAVFADPVFRVLSDLVGVKRIQAGHVDPAAATATYTVTAAEAAEQLGVTGAAVRAALTGRRLAGQLINGQWYTSPQALASFRVSTRGRPKSPPADAGATDPDTNRVTVIAGSHEGVNLAVRCPGFKPEKGRGPRLVGDLPAGWTRAVVRTVGAKGAPRAFEIEHAPGNVEAVKIGPFSVVGAFRVVKKLNGPKAATEAWEGAAK